MRRSLSLAGNIISNRKLWLLMPVMLFKAGVSPGLMSRKNRGGAYLAIAETVESQSQQL